jgi:uncharacterized protein with PIN domain
MKTIDEIIDEYPDVYRWENGTLDLCFFDKTTPFLYQVNASKCLRCDTPLSQGNEMRIAEITENIKGVQLECEQCGLHYFLHQQVKFNVD